MSDRNINIDSREGFEPDNWYFEDNDDIYDDGEGFEDDEDFEFEDDGQPSEYEEWQDLNGGDDWDFGQYDE